MARVAPDANRGRGDTQAAAPMADRQSEHESVNFAARPPSARKQYGAGRKGVVQTSDGVVDLRRPKSASESEECQKMQQVRLPPHAPVLLESMRAIGYDVASAVADILDNSVTAGASRVQIRFDPGRPRAVAFVDDGAGMDADELMSAMRHGSKNPSDSRSSNDLGRFGLGLKTASMSQCRRLTVLSRSGPTTSGMVWDLDDVGAAEDWMVGVLDPEEVAAVPFADLLFAETTGTLVVWEKLDRLAAEDPGDGTVLSDRMARVTDHLSLVFHRFLSGRPALRIEVNRKNVEPMDPFLEDAGSLVGPEETIYVDKARIGLRAYTLPHISRLTKTQIDKAGGELGLRRQQGFYVYRERRLIIWGTWFRLFRQEELTKLTRVRVDVPNSLDHLWSLDIKKSAASPPAAIRDRLRGLVPTMANASRAAHQFRGRATGTGSIQPLWRRVEERDGIRYEVAHDHPVVAAFRLSLDPSLVHEFDNVLRAVSGSLPVEALYNDRANDKIGHRTDAEDDPEIFARLEELARQMLASFEDQPAVRKQLLAGLGTIEPFALSPKLVPKLQKRLS